MDELPIYVNIFPFLEDIGCTLYHSLTDLEKIPMDAAIIARGSYEGHANLVTAIRNMKSSIILISLKQSDTSQSPGPIAQERMVDNFIEGPPFISKFLKAFENLCGWRMCLKKATSGLVEL